jgi:hypothetical protein
MKKRTRPILLFFLFLAAFFVFTCSTQAEELPSGVKPQEITVTAKQSINASLDFEQEGNWGGKHT